MEFIRSRAGALLQLNEASLAARPWVQSGYKFRPASQHDKAGHEFRFARPYYGWVQAQVGDVDFTMFSSNDDGVAIVYHSFGPDSYEAASVAAWTMIAPTCGSIADIGAFTGLFSILAQRKAPNASVIAVEPNSAARARLFINMVANGCYPSVRVAPYAVSNTVSTLPLHVAWGPDILDTGSSLSASSAHRLQSRTEIVTAAPIDVILDQFQMPPLDLAKIDVEGLEDVALAGALRTLSHRPTLFLEIQDANKFTACYNILKEFGYNIYIIDDTSINLIPYNEENPAEWFASKIGHRVVNFFCSAREQHSALAQQGVARIAAKLR